MSIIYNPWQVLEKYLWRKGGKEGGAEGRFEGLEWYLKGHLCRKWQNRTLSVWAFLRPTLLERLVRRAVTVHHVHLTCPSRSSDAVQWAAPTLFSASHLRVGWSGGLMRTKGKGSISKGVNLLSSKEISIPLDTPLTLAKQLQSLLPWQIMLLLSYWRWTMELWTSLLSKNRCCFLICHLWSLLWRSSLLSGSLRWCRASEAQECLTFLLVQKQERVKSTHPLPCHQHLLRFSGDCNRISFHPSQFGFPNCHGSISLGTYEDHLISLKTEQNQIQINRNSFKITWNNQTWTVVQEVTGELEKFGGC